MPHNQHECSYTLVATLSRGLDHLLSLGFPVLALTEARVGEGSTNGMGACV